MQNIQDQKTAILKKESLFRIEVMEYQGARQYGTVLLTQPLSHSVMAGIFGGIAILLLVFFAVFETTRKVQTQGVLIPNSGLIKVVPTQPGLISNVHVKVGQDVVAGQVLFVLSGERSSTNADLTQESISALLRDRRDSFDGEIKQSQLQAMQRINLLQQRQEALREDVERVKGQIRLQQLRVSLAEQSVKRFAELQATNYVSPAQLQEKQGELFDQQQKLADLSRAQSSLQRESLSTKAEIEDQNAQVKRESAALRRNAAEIEQDLLENEARREILVRAPSAGTIGAVPVDKGQHVTSDTTLAALSPAGTELEAEVFVTSRAIGFVKPGMAVLLRYQAYPYEKFGQHTARVAEIARTALSARELSVPGSSAETGEPLYRVRLKLDKQDITAFGKQVPLRAGMLIDASIALEHRKLYEWVLEPLFSISGRL